MAWKLPSDLRTTCRESAAAILHDKTQPDSLRVSSGLSLLRLIGNETHPGIGELPNPLEHEETKSVWAAMYDPMQRLALLAESKSIDSTLLRVNFQSRYYAELDQLHYIVDRLVVIECGPHTGPLAAELASIQSMLLPHTLKQTAPPTISMPSELLDRLERATVAITKAKPTKPKPKRKPSLVKQDRPPTTKEMQTLEVVGRHKQNFHAAARELGKNPSTVRENYERALAKSARLLGGKSRSVNASPLPIDRRGIQDTKDQRGG